MDVYTNPHSLEEAVMTHPNTDSRELHSILLQFISEYHQGLNELAGHGNAIEQAERQLEAYTTKQQQALLEDIEIEHTKELELCIKETTEDVLDWVLKEVVGTTPLINSHATAAYENLRQSQRQIIEKKKGGL